MRRKSNNKRARSRLPGALVPPSFVSSKRTSGRARYLCASAGTYGITRADLLNHLILNTSSLTVNYRLFTAFRLKSVEIWASTATLGSTVTASLQWTSEYGPDSFVTDTSVGTARPLHLRTSPPAQTLASFWCLSASNESVALFYLTLPANAVIDITYDAIIDGNNSVLATTTNNGVIGQIYMAYLGGVTTTSLVPVGYPSLT